MVVLGTSNEKVQKSFKNAVSELKAAGLQVHEVELGADGAQILGWHFSADGHLGPTRKRFWKIRLATRHMLGRGRATSKQVEKLLGHCCFLALARRECLSVFGQAYTFVQRYAGSRKEYGLWLSVRREFELFDGILPLVYRDLTAPWNETIYAVDASEWGLGCTVGECERQQVKAVGGVCERWRFKDPLFAKARLHTLHEPDSVLPHLHEEFSQTASAFSSTKAEFEGVPFEIVDRRWHVCGRHKWVKSSSMPVNEARATLYGAKHILRNRENFHQRHVILSDSMTSTCAFSRGRAHTYELRRVCQQFGALCLATGAQITVRWIPSEWNPSDNPSRGKWTASVPEQFPEHGFAPAHTCNVKTRVTQKRSQKKFSSPPSSPLPSQLWEQPDLVLETTPMTKSKKEDGSTGDSGKEEGGAEHRAISAAAGVGFKAKSQPIQHPLGRVEATGFEEEWKAEGCGSGRQRGVQAFGNKVPGWRGHQPSQLPDSSSTFLQPRTQVSEHDKASFVQTVDEGVAQFVSNPEPAANTLGGDCSPSGGVCEPAVDFFCDPLAAHVCSLPAANRGPTPSKGRCGATHPSRREKLPEVGRCDSSTGVRAAFQDKGVRREPDVRPGLSPGDRPCAGQIQQKHVQARADLETHQCRASDVLAASTNSAGSGTIGGDTPVSIQARRGITRLRLQETGSTRHSTARTLAVTSQRTQIPKGRQTLSGVWIAQSGSSTKMHCGRKTPTKAACQPALKVPSSLHETVFIEFFSGSGRLGQNR